jgi:DNA-binding NarL/FixJ family response regulator
LDTSLNGSAVPQTAVLLDQHPLWLSAVEQVLERCGITVCGKTTHPAKALELISEHGPGVFVTGISMPDGEMEGIECLRQAVQRTPGLKAIVLSSHREPAYVDAALEAGAVAYVIKTAHPDDIASVVRQAFSSSVYLAPARRATTLAPVRPTGAAGELTKRELEILKLAAEGHSNSQLAKMLWVTEQTVKFHLSNIYRKLNVSNRTEAARWAQIHGVLSDHDTAALSVA